ncbi:hypothetical protein BC938DRAFT_475932 [Jimgerdemannia flammicorona]|uniref:Secreted protein n=1 Tax=Jimgerdemannia flammicorona TaxID=994334 RepID=A0A433QR61_9FUNG|nr:hypothetical protein BC938DRAFT_475932 [Jimgerdemannia flammicorona]
MRHSRPITGRGFWLFPSPLGLLRPSWGALLVQYLEVIKVCCELRCATPICRWDIYLSCTSPAAHNKQKKSNYPRFFTRLLSKCFHFDPYCGNFVFL